MNKKRQAGYDQAKQQHLEGRSIDALVLAAMELPSGQYAIGFLSYVVDQQIEEMRQSKVKP